MEERPDQSPSRVDKERGRCPPVGAGRERLGGRSETLQDQGEVRGGCDGKENAFGDGVEAVDVDGCKKGGCRSAKNRFFPVVSRKRRLGQKIFRLMKVSTMAMATTCAIHCQLISAYLPNAPL